LVGHQAQGGCMITTRYGKKACLAGPSALARGLLEGVGLIIRIMFLVIPAIQSLEAGVWILAGSALL